MGNECTICENTKKNKNELQFDPNNSSNQMGGKVVVSNGNIAKKKTLNVLSQGIQEVHSKFLNGMRQDTQEDDSDNVQPDIQPDCIADKIITNDQQIHKKYQIALQIFSSSQLQSYKDQEFPPEKSSITKDNSFQIANRCVWRRAIEFSLPQQQFGKPTQYDTFNNQNYNQTQFQQQNSQWQQSTNNNNAIRVFSGKIEPNDIKQGSLGDCYFLSSLSALAERPNLISRLFVTQNYNDKGLYCVWLCIDGEWGQVILDDYFPCFQNQGPAFSKSHGPELWVLLLEKAYAKSFGSYNKIEAGLTGSAIRDLTGAPSEFKITSKEKPDELWNYMLENERKKFILTAGSQSDDRGIETQQETGIVSSHAYAILDVQEVTSSEGKKERIIQLRNPWGSKEWNGDWSDSSNKWTPELKAKLNVQNRNDGTFWMPLESFIKEFNDVTVNRLHESYFYSFQKGSFNNNQLISDKTRTVKKQARFANQDDEFTNSFGNENRIASAIIFELEVQKNATHCYISINQKDKRHYNKDPNKQSNYDYSYAKLIICRGSANEVKKYVGSKGNQSRNVDVECEQLNKGTYFAYVEIDWNNSQIQQPEFILSVYSSSPIIISQNTLLLSKEEANLFIDKIMMVKDPDETDALFLYEEDNNICRYVDSLPGYVFFNYQNKSENSSLKEQMTIKDRQNLQICNPFKNSDFFEIEIQSQQQKIIKFKVEPSGEGYSYSYSFTYQISMSDDQLIEKIKQSSGENKKQRTLQGRKIDVWVYSYFYNGGVAVFYENLTNQVYNEKLRFKLNNLIGINVNVDQEIIIKIMPKKNYLIKLKEIDSTCSNTNFSTSVQFWLTQPGEQ